MFDSRQTQEFDLENAITKIRPQEPDLRNMMPAQATHDHTHHHGPGQGHPPARIGPSLLRMTVVARLAFAAALIAVLWAVVIWSMS
jgi:hypothetical protein